MTRVCVAALLLSVVLMNVGAQAAPATTLELVGIVGGVVLFAIGAVLMVVVAAGQPIVLPNAEPWGGDDE